MKLQSIPIAILMISLISLGMTGYITSLTDSYGQTADLSSLNNTQESMEKTRQSAMELSETIIDFELESVEDFFFIPYVMVKVGWSAAKTVFNSWETLASMVTDLNNGLNDLGIPVPSYFFPIIIAVFVLTTVAILIYGFFKWRFED